jgi:Tol biopolymer transport system component
VALLVWTTGVPVSGAATGTVLVSRDAEGRPTKASGVGDPAASDTASVAFSTGWPLLPDDVNQASDVYVRDVRTGALTLASVASDGTQGDSSSYRPALSADARHVAFVSLASTLTAGDHPLTPDVFVHDLRTGTTTLVSVDAEGGPAEDAFGFPGFVSISDDGRRVAFESAVEDIDPSDNNGTADVFLRDVVAGTTTRLSAGLAGGGGGVQPSVSGDGTAVAFASAASDLVPGDADDGIGDIFLWRPSGTVRVTNLLDGERDNEGASHASASEDGRYVAYLSQSKLLVPGPQNEYVDVFVTDVATGTTTLVSVGADGQPSSDHSDIPAISADGRRVVFRSMAKDLVPGSGPERPRSDVFLRDLTTGTTTLVSTDVDGRLANSYSQMADISPDGHTVVFMTWATDLVDEPNRGGIMARRVPPPG